MRSQRPPKTNTNGGKIEKGFRMHFGRDGRRVMEILAECAGPVGRIIGGVQEQLWTEFLNKSQELGKIWARTGPDI